MRGEEGVGKVARWEEGDQGRVAGWEEGDQGRRTHPTPKVDRW